MPMNTRAAQDKQRTIPNSQSGENGGKSSADSPSIANATMISETCNENKDTNPVPAGIVNAIIEAFGDKKLLDKLIPALSQALHECYMAEIAQRDETIKSLQSQVDETRAQLDDLEQYSRRNCLLIHGVPETTPQNTDNIVRNLAKDKLNQEISPLDIDRSHRIGQRGKKDAKGRQLIRPIIVKFSRYSTRSQFYAARKNLKGSKIFIHENLTSTRQAWFHDVRKKYPAPDNKVWSQDGKIKIRTHDNKFLSVWCRPDKTQHSPSMNCTNAFTMIDCQCFNLSAEIFNSHLSYFVTN